ncbi:MAG: sensor domain-containing diguanylate cyclase [Gammaproteobacteria bacterium]|nr:sensor domain-containing diguanylate cyclase [Gammaproteobacteria bacterium]
MATPLRAKTPPELVPSVATAHPAPGPCLFHDLAEASPEPLLITRIDVDAHRIIYANPAFYRLSGCTAAQIVGREWQSLVESGFHVGGADAQLTAMRRDDARIELRVQDAFGDERHLTMSRWVLRDDRGDATHLVVLMRDVTFEQSRRDGLEHRACHDALTGLANRYLFRDHFLQARAHARRHRSSFILALIDIDDFKSINDGFGHHGGDQVLKCFGARLSASIRAENTVARLGGDEFVLLLDTTADGEPMHRLIARLRAMIGRPMILDGRALTVSCSVGISRYPVDGEDLERLLQVADATLYRVKANRHAHAGAANAAS